MSIPIIAETTLGVLTVILIMIRIAVGGKRYQTAYEYGTCKTIGKREIQEDEFGIVHTEDGIMAVLADGMGKQYGGRIAGRVTVDTFTEIFENPNAFYNPHYYFRKAFHGANRNILNTLEEENGFASAAAVMIKGKKLYYASVGNVKIAVYRGGELVPITSGHTIGRLADLKYKEGKLTRQDAANLLDKHRLYNYLGQDGFHEIEFFDTPVTLKGGEDVLLISDGLYDGIGWKNIEKCLAQKGTCEEKTLEMIEKVNQKTEEDTDNASVVMIHINI